MWNGGNWTFLSADEPMLCNTGKLPFHEKSNFHKTSLFTSALPPVCQPENIIFTKKRQLSWKKKIILIFKFFLFVIKKIN
jgi:hypothetical protein